MYTTRNFRTKKELKEAVAAWVRQIDIELPADIRRARPVTYYQPGPFGGNEPRDGDVFVQGPHYPEPHRWYASCIAKNSVIVKVK